MDRPNRQLTPTPQADIHFLDPGLDEPVQSLFSINKDLLICGHSRILGMLTENLPKSVEIVPVLECLNDLNTEGAIHHISWERSFESLFFMFEPERGSKRLLVRIDPEEGSIFSAKIGENVHDFEIDPANRESVWVIDESEVYAVKLRPQNMQTIQINFGAVNIKEEKEILVSCRHQILKVKFGKKKEFFYVQGYKNIKKFRVESGEFVDTLPLHCSHLRELIFSEDTSVIIS